MVPNKKTPGLTAVQQYMDFKKNLPAWSASCHKDEFSAKAIVQPTPLSDCYTVRITYRYGQQPNIRVLNKKLRPRTPGGKIKHTFKDGSLCLYYAKTEEWSKRDFISLKIVPWISLWLYYYEIWLSTGEWLGGGIEH